MNNSASIRPILLSLFLISLICKAQENGWQDLNWGMSIEEIRERHPNVARNDDTNTYKQEGKTYLAEWRIDSYELAGHQFYADLLMDDAYKLAGVAVKSPDLSKDAGSTLFNNIESLLTRKYGQPEASDDLQTGKIQKWFLPEVTIKLTYYYIEILNESWVNVIYLQPLIEDLEKL